jgi:hypothetical protein
MVNVTIYSIHGSYGIGDTHELSSVLFSDVPCDIPSHFGTTQEAGMSYKVAPQFS